MATKKTRIKHSPEFKAEAMKLAEKVGVAAAARQLFYMNPKSTGGGRTRRKTPILVSESKRLPSSKGSWLSKQKS